MNENDHSATPGSEHTSSGHTGARRRRRPRRRVTRPAGSLAVSFSDDTFSDAHTPAPHHSPEGAEAHAEPVATPVGTPVTTPEFQSAAATNDNFDGAPSGNSNGDPSGASNGASSGASNDNSETTDQSSPREELESALHDLPSKEEAPFAAVSISTSGIHPKTSRLVALSVVFFGPGAEAPGDAAHPDELPTINIGDEVGALTRHLNPGEDAGPWHLHGYQVTELSQALGFNSSAQLIHRALDGRTLIMHESDYVWGFLTHEFKLSQRSANRGRRSRGRGRAGRRLPIPAPVSIIDTLATARRQAADATDPRLRAIVASYGLAPNSAHTDPAPGSAPTTEAHTSANVPANASRSAVQASAAALPEVGAVASISNKDIDPDTLLEANARLTAALALAQQRSGELTVLDPEDLAADQFGLRRSGLRIDAANSPRPYVNPGAWKRGEPLVEGMEFVVSPDVAIDPDVLIGQGVAAGLAYSEKLNRRSSLVVCNENYELRGKAMHADRKGIPLIRDEDFLALLDSVQPGEKEAVPTKPGADARPRTSGLAGPQGGSGKSGSSSGNSGSSSGGSGNSGSSSNAGNSGTSGTSAHNSSSSGNSGPNSGGHRGHIPGSNKKRNRRRRRRRKGSRGSNGSGGSGGKSGSGGSGGENSSSGKNGSQGGGKRGKNINHSGSGGRGSNSH
ncbi:DNA polymerase III subunit epsilon [Corynebacterium macclintockiae]|uniref:DNA polymerase III subunit epsilon n=1 Tax=Corynebacterium macclintockiae TaxID=2913501 RepID=UPI00254DA1EA|nr:DNA polymerase III subunit epsilon [Corynebacterium macclintockiae]MDK8891061.1 DNA polymerase III subunit epsilon [Corynebacterium macclintockiae]